MWRGDAAVWGRHAPILFPYCGRLRGGAFTHRGVRYEGGQHGFARDMEHALVEKGVEENDTVLIGEYQFDYIF